MVRDIDRLALPEQYSPVFGTEIITELRGIEWTFD